VPSRGAGYEFSDTLLEKLLTPEQNEQEIERRNEEKGRRIPPMRFEVNIGKCR
jgi:hypothetical protein